MPSPLPWIIAVALGAVMVSKSQDADKEDADRSKRERDGDGVQLANGCLADAGTSDAQRELLDRLVTDETITPEDLYAAAARLDAMGQPQAAQCLRDVAVMRHPGGVEDDDPVPPEAGAYLFEIGWGHTPYHTALYYTGDGMRYPELGALNPHLGTFSGNAYPGWVPGVKIWLPASWNAEAKPPMPRADLPEGYDMPEGYPDPSVQVPEVTLPGSWGDWPEAGAGGWPGQVSGEIPTDWTDPDWYEV